MLLWLSYGLLPWIYTFCEFCPCRGSIRIWANELFSVLAPGVLGAEQLRLSSFTRSAYLRVLRVCSQQEAEGEIFPIIVVLQFPVNESFRTWVSFEPLKGVCFLVWSKARMHSLSASNDLLISAPSIRVCLLVSMVSAPRSLPARSMNDSFPNTFF